MAQFPTTYSPFRPVSIFISQDSHSCTKNNHVLDKIQPALMALNHMLHIKHMTHIDPLSLLKNIGRLCEELPDRFLDRFLDWLPRKLILRQSLKAEFYLPVLLEFWDVTVVCDI